MRREGGGEEEEGFFKTTGNPESGYSRKEEGKRKSSETRSLFNFGKALCSCADPRSHPLSSSP
jgi:hypothetical protein